MGSLKNKWQELPESFRMIPAALIAALLLSRVLFVFSIVKGRSMVPSIPENMIVIGSRLSYHQNPPERGDIVVFSHPGIEPFLIKRIAAIPGDRIRICGRLLWINGIPCAGNAAITKSEIPVQCREFSIPEEAFFVIGDNFPESNDSRIWEEPLVRRNEIAAKGIFLYKFPFQFKKIGSEVK